MSTLKSNVIEPATGTTLSLGASGDNVLVSSDSLQTNLYKDSGGNTLFQSDGAGTLSNVNSQIKGGGPMLISTADASQVTGIEITSSIDSTYDRYMFFIINWNPNTDGEAVMMNCSIDGGSNYNVTKTSTAFETGKGENGVEAGPVPYVGQSLNENTGYQQINNGPGFDADQSLSGIMNLWSPSSTTHVKFYSIVSNVYSSTNYAYIVYQAGYFNTTTAINAIRFQGYSVGTFDAKIKMYGVA